MTYLGMPNHLFIVDQLGASKKTNMKNTYVHNWNAGFVESVDGEFGRDANCRYEERGFLLDDNVN